MSMERLTGRYEMSGLACYAPNGKAILMRNLTQNALQKILDRLADYEDAEEQGLLVRLPFKVGDTIYRICPKCNAKHNGSCANCAWEGTAGANGCSVFGLWEDGQYPAEKCQVIPWEVTYERIPLILSAKSVGKLFRSKEEAEAVLRGDSICQ